MSYGKLVRDKIPEIIKNNGELPITRVLSDDEYKLELEKKLIEECNEVITASGSDRIEELADLLEVMMSLSKLENASIENIIENCENKRIKRGGFNDKIYLENVVKNS